MAREGFVEEECGAEQGGAGRAEAQDGMARVGARGGESDRLGGDEEPAGDAVIGDDDAGGRDGEALQQVGVGDVPRPGPERPREEEHAEQHRAEQAEHSADVTMPRQFRGDDQQSGPRAVVETEEGHAFAAVETWLAREKNSRGENDPRAGEIGRRRPEREVADEVKGQYLIRRTHKNLPHEPEIRADQAEIGKAGPRVADEKHHRRRREHQIGDHGEFTDRRDRRAEIRQRDRKDRQQLRLTPLRQDKHARRPRQQEKSAQERARDDLQLPHVGRAVERIIKAGESTARERSPINDEIAALALQPKSTRKQAAADEREDAQFGPRPEILVKILVGHDAEENQREQREDDADARQPAPELNLEANAFRLDRRGRAREWGQGYGWRSFRRSRRPSRDRRRKRWSRFLNRLRQNGKGWQRALDGIGRGRRFQPRGEVAEIVLKLGHGGSRL